MQAPKSSKGFRWYPGKGDSQPHTFGLGAGAIPILTARRLKKKTGTGTDLSHAPCGSLCGSRTSLTKGEVARQLLRSAALWPALPIEEVRHHDPGAVALQFSQGLPTGLGLEPRTVAVVEVPHLVGPAAAVAGPAAGPAAGPVGEEAGRAAQAGSDPGSSNRLQGSRKAARVASSSGLATPCTDPREPSTAQPETGHPRATQQAWLELPSWNNNRFTDSHSLASCCKAPATPGASLVEGLRKERSAQSPLNHTSHRRHLISNIKCSGCVRLF